MNKNNSLTNNSLMSFLYAILIVLLVIFSVQLTMRLKVFFNIKNNTGKLQLKFINIKILDYKISLQNQCLCLTNKKGKNKYLPLELNQQSIQNYNDFESILFRKIYFKTMAIYFNFGIKSNAFASAMICGYVDVFSKIFYSIFKTKKSELIMQLKIFPSFNNNVIKFGFKAKISLSVLDFIWSFIEANLTKQVRSLKYKENDDARK